MSLLLLLLVALGMISGECLEGKFSTQSQKPFSPMLVSTATVLHSPFQRLEEDEILSTSLKYFPVFSFFFLWKHLLRRFTVCAQLGFSSSSTFWFSASAMHRNALGRL
jgi:hypothetical protein